MPAFRHWSRRKVAGPTGLTVAAALLAACSLTAPATFTPQQSVAEATDVPTASPAPTATPTATSEVPPSAAPTGPPPPTATWHTVVKPLTAPAAWLDFGFTANGDIIAIGSHQAKADPLRLFVARFSPTGRKRWEHDLNRSVTPIAGDWAAIDPTDGAIVIDDFRRPTVQFTLRWFSSKSGFNESNLRTDSGINRLAIDARGRLYGLPQYGVDGNAYAAIVRLDAKGRVRTGVDYWLRPLDAGARPDRPGILAFPTAIAIGRDGRVIVVDEPDVNATYPDGTPRQAAVVTSLTPNLGSPRQWELPVEWPFGSEAFGTWSHRLSIAGGADGSLYVGEPVLDDAGTSIAGWRVRHFSVGGGAMESWGTGAPASGVVHPSHPEVDAEGRLWVIDTNPATRTSVIAVLSLPA